MKLDAALKWLRSKLGCGYVYGAYGQICTQDLLDRLEAQWGPGHKYDLAKKWIGKQVFDCVNYIKVCRRELDGVWDDVSAHTLYLQCQPKSLSLAKPGDLLFRVRNGHAEHVGFVSLPGRVLEARSTARGVVESVISTNDWTCAAKNPWVEYPVDYDPEIQKAAKAGVITDPALWQDYLDGKKPVNPGHLKALLTKFNARL